MKPRRQVLLTSATYYGTLGAARLLGSHGWDVTVADPARAAPASWSRHIARRVHCPPPSAPVEFVEWMLDFGRQSPGHLYYPTSDDLAWVTAARAGSLARHFVLLAPPIGALERLLDKGQLHAMCTEAGLATPATWFPRDRTDLEQVVEEIKFPALIKQRTQVLSSSHSKGIRVAGPRQLMRAFEEFARANSHDPVLEFSHPEACRPMVQEYLPEAHEGGLVMAGFVDRDGRVLAARAANRLLSRPRRLGISLCLEETPLEPGLVDSVERICRLAGYFGVFHVEFIRVGDRRLLIDFNPRYYHHMSFEIARGMPLPLFVAHAALGERAALDRLADGATRSSEPRNRAFTHGRELRVTTLGQLLTGAMSLGEYRKWSGWMRGHAGAMVDAVWDRADPWPSAFDALHGAWDLAQHPRAFVRRILLDR